MTDHRQRFWTVFRGEKCDIEMAILSFNPMKISLIFHSGNTDGKAPTRAEIAALARQAQANAERALQ